METFEAYLSGRKRLRPASVRHYVVLTSRFTTWLESQGVAPAHANTADILDYLSFQQNSGASYGVRKSSLTALRHYFAWLLGQNACDFNPATGLYLKNRRKTVPMAALPLTELHQLYQDLAATSGKTLKDKVVTGLLIYQGLRTGELARIMLRDIDLKAGLIYIRACRRTGARVLKLDAGQVYYLGLLMGEKQADQLLLPAGKFPHNYYKHLLRRLKKRLPQLKNISHIRQSVIGHWTAAYDLRVVQQMAGHLWVGSTQRYDLASLQTLQSEIQALHPLNSDNRDYRSDQPAF